jgi:hypothetical protein
MREIKESDWKILRQLHKVTLERFCEEILLDLGRISSDRSRSSHEKYLDLCAHLQKRDKEIAKAFDSPRRSNAYLMIATLKRQGFMTEEEFARFSQETRETVDVILGVARL